MDPLLPSLADVERLQENPDTDARRALALKLGHSYVQRRFGARERGIADDIVRAIARDVEVEVRKALAQTIASSTDIPQDVALRMAHDVIEVAEPILKASDLLDDDMLIEIVKSRSEDHRVAIAARAIVREPVSAAIVDHAEVRAVATLAANAGADIAESAMSRAVDRFGADETVAMPLADRPSLPLAIAERLVALVSSRLKAQMAGEGERYRQFSEGLSQVSEGAAFILGGGEADVLDLIAMMDQLHAAGKLQPSLVIRAGRLGDRELMQAAISRITGIRYGLVVEAFDQPDTARRMLREVGLVPSEIDEVVPAAA
ncbi:DUF2336 domain-containing protein [Sphingosinicella soli]|uniref:Uncharacterized protein (DUF2336 family) n=1 Tax=Sphingosinicella soli TaxID=333708 RepID=A0A7W7F5G8_9SPHN|nr:DUF2336 domain-containing protein [Sphingosinicella soli]MBB4630517.1 uncharacterized protein (DUF2336 family) [Sphingosinicella soli]